MMVVFLVTSDCTKLNCIGVALFYCMNSIQHTSILKSVHQWQNIVLKKSGCHRFADWFYSPLGDGGIRLHPIFRAPPYSIRLIFDNGIIPSNTSF